VSDAASSLWGDGQSDHPEFPLLTQVAVLCVFFLGLTGTIRAADDRVSFVTKPLDIRVEADEFGRASSADITAVLQSAASEIWRHCRRIRLEGIDVYHRTDHPQTDFKRTSSGRIAIGLATQGPYWAQYSFQFAHEFCHALANYGNNPRQLVRYQRYANLWLEESLCETASLFALRAMSRSWRTSPLPELAELRSLVQRVCGGANRDGPPQSSEWKAVLNLVPRA
jgi:hypothetical protein